MRGRKPIPGPLAPGKAAAAAPTALPRCPAHLSDVARKEWRRIAKPLNEVGLLSTMDRAALAAYCQSYGRWVEAEQKLKETPVLLKTPSGYAQQSPWLSIANKQLELMGRYMAELGLSPSARRRVVSSKDGVPAEKIDEIRRVIVRFHDENGVVTRSEPEDDPRQSGPPDFIDIVPLK